ncbi:hypothetical protein, partial [Burkholderia gladioli]|uniref:hypothetical protein n=1 Tax=Burkholderia gladioli TaxID=28095 RepID=UPI003132BB66
MPQKVEPALIAGRNVWCFSAGGTREGAPDPRLKEAFVKVLAQTSYGLAVFPNGHGGSMHRDRRH